MVREELSNKMTFEQRPGGSEGASNRCVWRRRFQADATAGRKTRQSSLCLARLVINYSTSLTIYAELSLYREIPMFLNPQNIDFNTFEEKSLKMCYVVPLPC